MYGILCERAERASFKTLAFSHSNTAISLNNLLVLQILCFRNIFNFRCQHSPYIYNHQINAVSFYYSWYGAIYKRQYTEKTLTLRNVCACERAKRASLENFGIFTFLNCYFFRYFVGTSDALSVQIACLSAYMYRQIYQCTDKFPNVPTKVRKDIIGGAIAPAPPRGYANEYSGLVVVVLVVVELFALFTFKIEMKYITKQTNNWNTTNTITAYTRNGISTSHWDYKESDTTSMLQRL